jgi:CRP-like cAMP-binding protein
MSVAEIAAELEVFSALASLNEEQLKGLALNVQRTRYRSGSWLCREGDEGTCCYFILSGSVSISKQLGDGRKVYLSTLVSGHLFGQTGLIAGQLRTADVTATSEVEILVLERSAMNRGLDRGQPWATGLQTLIASHLVRQLRGALNRLEILAGQEDASSEAEGRKRSEIVKPKGIDVDFSGPRGKRPTRPGTTAGENKGNTTKDTSEPAGDEHDDWVPLPPVADTTREELYELLQATEAGLGGTTDFELETVRVVIDEDAWGRTMKPL